MSKSLFSILVSFIFIFCTNSPAWSVGNDIKLDKPNFSLSETNTLASESISNNNQYTWVANIFFPGLGQMLMGEVFRGLKFPLIMIGGPILIVFLITGGRVGGGMGQFALILAFYASVIFCIPFYIWSIIDAHLMSQDYSKNHNNLKESISIKENSIANYNFNQRVYSF